MVPTTTGPNEDQEELPDFDEEATCVESNKTLVMFTQMFSESLGQRAKSRFYRLLGCG